MRVSHFIGSWQEEEKCTKVLCYVVTDKHYRWCLLSLPNSKKRKEIRLSVREIPLLHYRWLSKSLCWHTRKPVLFPSTHTKNLFFFLLTAIRVSSHTTTLSILRDNSNVVVFFFQYHITSTIQVFSFPEFLTEYPNVRQADLAWLVRELME